MDRIEIEILIQSIEHKLAEQQAESNCVDDRLLEKLNKLKQLLQGV